MTFKTIQLFLAAVFLLTQSNGAASSSASHSDAAFVEFYKDRSNWRQFMRMKVFADDLELYNAPLYTTPKSFETLRKTVVYNNDEHQKISGYKRPNLTPDWHVIQGKSLEHDKQVGYNIHLPEGEIKAVFVQVYGGGGGVESPGVIRDFNKELMRHGIAVVTLNCRDTLPDGWGNMATIAQEHILQENIHHFYEALSKNPESLDPALAALKEKPIYLFGQSWGGGTTVIHATRYPGTFTGYISHDGGLSLDRRDHAPDRSSDIAKIIQPVLIIHNFNDNNVSLKDSIAWYQKALNAGKRDLVNLYISPIGHMVRGDLVGSGFDDPLQRGHGIPTTQKSLKEYVKVLLYFMDRSGNLRQHGLNQLRAHQGSLRHGKRLVGYEFRDPKIDDMFISHAYTLYKKDPKRYDVDAAWESTYVPLYHRVAYVESMEGSVATERAGQIVLTPASITKMLQKQLPEFLQFYKEMTQKSVPQTQSAKTLAANEDLHSAVKERFPDCIFECKELLRFYYKGNPETVPPVSVSPEKLNELKARLKAEIAKEKKLLHGVVHGSVVSTIAAKKAAKSLMARKAAREGSVLQ